MSNYLGRDEYGGTFDGEAPAEHPDEKMRRFMEGDPQRRDAVDQAIALVRGGGAGFQVNGVTALVLADAVEELRSIANQRRNVGWALDETRRRLEAAEAERDRLREALDDTNKAAIDLSNDVTRLARQVANLEAALCPFAAQPCGKLSPSWDGPDFIPCGECKVCRARAALDAAHSREQQDG